MLDTVVDERTMRELYLTAFEIAIKEGKPRTIMSSYNMINGTHANENLHVLRDILRDEWGYKNVVVTDWAGCNDRVMGLIAGNELEMPSCLYSNEDLLKALTKGYEIPADLDESRPGDQYDRIVAAFKDGKLDVKYLDEALDRLLDLVFTTEKAFEGRDPEAPLRVRRVEEHHEMAKKCARECIVLLRNENDTLPLAGGTKVAVIGDFAKVPRYQGAGSSVVNPTKLDSPLECLGFAITKTDKNPLPDPRDVIGAPGRQQIRAFGRGLRARLRPLRQEKAFSDQRRRGARQARRSRAGVRRTGRGHRGGGSGPQGHKHPSAPARPHRRARGRQGQDGRHPFLRLGGRTALRG